MKICYLADGESIHTKRWLEYFIKVGHEVHLISFNNPSINGIKFHKITTHFPNLKFRYLFILNQVKKMIRKINPDVLHSHYVLTNGFLGAYSGFHPFVVSVWGSDVLVSTNSRIYRWMVKFALKRTDLVTCDAEHIKEPLMKLGASPKKIILIYYGTDIKKFNPKQRSKELRERLRIFDSPMIISLRNLELIYDIKSLIASIPLVLKKIPETKFVIVGNGSQEAGLKRLAKSLGISNSIRFVGMIPNDEVPIYLASADVYVSTSLSDAGLASSTAEAMACELPVIITDFGDNRKWVEDGINGFLIPTKDPESLAKNIIYLLENKDIRIKFGKINRKIVKERLDYYKEMERMERFYKNLVKG